MKKILTILAVALLACTTVFAGVTFSGSSTFGYLVNVNDGNWSQYFYGDDGDDTDPNTLKVSIADDNGLWTVGLRTGYPDKAATFGDTGSMGGDVTIDFAKLFGLDGWKLNAGMIGNDRYTTLRAYSNQSGNNYDRIRTVGGSYVAWVGVGYGDLVEAQLAVDPGLNAGADDKISSKSDILASVLVTPLDGLKVSVDYAWKGEYAWKDGVATNDKGLVGGAVDVNISDMLGLDFSVGVSVADRYHIGAKTNDLAVTVYGGVDVVDVAVEYAYTAAKDHYLYAKVNLNLIENMLLNVYFGANDVTKFADEVFVGGEVGYTLSGVTFKLAAEYAAGAAKELEYTGFNIAPSISFAW